VIAQRGVHAGRHDVSVEDDERAERQLAGGRVVDGQRDGPPQQFPFVHGEEAYARLPTSGLARRPAPVPTTAHVTGPGALLKIDVRSAQRRAFSGMVFIATERTNPGLDATSRLQ
jgi:hypothetical protein